MEKLREEIIELLTKDNEGRRRMFEMDSGKNFVSLAFPCSVTDDGEVYIVSIAIFEDRAVDICINAECKIKNHYKALKFVNNLNLNYVGLSFAFYEGDIYASSFIGCEIDAIEIVGESMRLLEMVANEVSMRS